jgi:branched-chain amino acid transport system substrate-binding protein
MAKGNKETVVLIATLAISLGLIGGGFMLLRRNLGNDNSVISTQPNRPPNVTPGNINDRISTGTQILFSDSSNTNKQAGVEAIAAQDYANAIASFQASLTQNRNDPEALVYLNNAKAMQAGNSLKIAASLPISSNPDAAKEILRGIAQAQNQVNQAGGINGALLEVAIADDGNDAQQAKQ